MKKILLFIFLVCTLFTQATNYYIKSGGSDAASGLSDALAWATPAKVTTVWAAGTFAPGDSILFKRGDTFYGTITVTESGTLANKIIIGAYGASNIAKPILQGWTTITGWTNEGSGIYSKTISGESAPTILSFDGVDKPMARTPNTGYYTINPNGTTTTVSSSSFNSTVTNWVGAEVIIKKNHWITDRGYISSHSGSVLTYTGGSTYSSLLNYGCFIQNDVRCLDVLGEWVYSGGKLYVYFGVEIPTNYTVKLVTLDRGVSISSYNYITILNINIQGYNAYGIYGSSTTGISASYCNISFIGNQGVRINNSTSFSVRNSIFSNCHNSAINSSSNSASTYIGYNTISNTSVIEGMSGNGDGNAFALASAGDNGIIEYNKVVNSGYIGIHSTGNGFVTRNNFVNTFCTLKDDGGGIYTYQATGTSTPVNERLIKNNIVINGIGAGAGTADNGFSAQGIYIDGWSKNVRVIDNTVSSCVNVGLYIQGYAEDIFARNNLLYNNKTQLHVTSSMATLPHDTIRSNILVNLNPSQKLFNYYKTTALGYTIAQIGVIDSNYYLNPFTSNNVASSNYQVSGKYYTIYDSYEKWKSTIDLHGDTIPVGIPKYTINSLISTNKFSNGTFTSNITGASLSYYLGTGSVTWDNTNQITNGSLKLTISSLSTNNNQAIVMLSVGAVSATNYILRFSVKGTTNNSSVEVSLRKSGTPYTILSAKQVYNISTSTTNYEVLLTCSEPMAAANLYFSFNDADGTQYLDNVEFYEANVTISNPNLYSSFAYNDTTINTAISFTGRYYDAFDNAYIGSKTLTPFTSAFLVKDISYVDNPVVAPTVTLDAITSLSSRDLSVYANTILAGGGTITERGICYNTSITPTTANNIQVNGSGLGTYYNHIIYLLPSTTYYIRAYAINEAGTAYSNQIIVSTQYSSKLYYKGKQIKLNGKIIKY